MAASYNKTTTRAATTSSALGTADAATTSTSATPTTSTQAAFRGRRSSRGTVAGDMQAAVGPNPVRHIIQRQLGNNVQGLRPALYRERLNVARNLYRRDLVAHYGCVNAIEFSDEGELLVSGEFFAGFFFGWYQSSFPAGNNTFEHTICGFSGGDDRRVLLWQMSDAMMSASSKPCVMQKQHQSNIFCLAVTGDNTKILSGGNDDVVMVHDIRT